MDLTGMKRRELQALCKRHGLPAGGTNADLVARLDAVLSGPADVDEEVAGVPARKGCLKQTGGDAAEAKKVTFVVEEGKARRLRSRVIWSPVVAKTRGKSARAGTDFAAEDGVSAEVGADVPVRRSRRNSVSAAEAEEVGEAVAVDRKRKRKNQDNDEGVAVSSQVGVSSRVTRRSALAGAAAVLPPAVEKKRGRRNAAESDVQKSALVEVSARTTRSRSIAPVVMPPTVAENKRRKTGDAQTTVELPIISDVPRNDVPATRSLRNKVVTVNNSVVDETHTTRQLENKMRPSTCRHQQVASSLEDKDQEKTAAPSKAHLLRRSQRNYSEANSANSETIKLAKDSNTAQPLARHNAHSEDLEKQPAVKEALKRSTRKSIVLATLEKEEKDVIEEKNPEAHVRRSVRKSVVLVKDFKGIVEEIQYANSEDAAKQPATKGSVRGLRRKSVISELHEKEKGLIAEKNMETDEGRLMRKPVMPVKNIKAVGEGIQIAKGKDVDKQFVVKQPTRRSSRKSVLPDMLENNSGLLSPKMNAEMNVRRSTRKSVLPDMLNEEKQDHRKMARNENLQSGKYQDGEKQQKAKDPIGQSRRSVATVLLEERNNDEEKKSKNPTRTSTHKSVALNAVEEVSMDHIEVGEEGLKLRKHRRFLLEISSSANDSWKHQNAQISNEKDNTEGRQQASNCTTSKGRSSKRRRTTASEEMTPFKVANDDIIIMEETKDTHEYNKESNSKVQENFQVNATREGFSSGPLLVTVAPSDEICTVQSVHVVIPGSESGDNANESSDKSKQPQEHSHTQAVDDHLSETRTGKLDRSTCIAGLVLDNCEVSEDKTLMSEDEDAQPSRSVADKKHDVDQGVAEEVLAQEKCNYQHVPAKTDLEMKLNDELAGPGMESGCSTTEKNEMLVADNLDQEGDLEKPSLCSATPECKQECGLPEETVFPSKKTGSLLCVEQSLFGLKSLFSQESIVESVGHSALASATTHTENGFDDSKDCHIKSALENVYVSEPFSHHDTKGGIFKNVDCMHTSQQDNGMEGLPEANPDEERVLSAFLLDAKHLKAVINSEVVSEGEGSKELLHSEDGKASSEKTDVNDGNGYGISDAVVRCALHAPADDNYEICLGFNTDVPRQVYNDRCSDVKEERLAPKSWTTDIIEGASAKCIESGDVLPDKERSNLKDWQLDSKLEGTEIVESGLYFNKDIGNILDSGSIGEITPSGSGLSKDSSVEYIEEVLDGFSMEASLDRSSTRGEQNGCSVDAIENPSVSLQTPGYKHEGALSEEAVCTKKNYAGTCLSNPRELIMELQSHFSKENIKESDPDDSLVFTTAENSADEQRVEVHHGSNLSQLGSTDLLDEPIGCSNTDVLCQCHNHQNQSNEDRVEEFEAAAAANYIESEVVLLPSEERSNLNEEQLNPKLESPNIMGSGLNCDKDVCNTSHNKSVFAIGNRTPSASGLLGDYRKDSDLQQELLDRFSVESSFQGNIFGKKTVSGVAGSEIPSLSLATPDYKHEDAFSEEAVCRTKNYTGMSSVDPRHLLMEVHSVYSEGSTEKSNLQDNLAFPSAESGKDEPIICHVEKLVDAHASSEPDTYQGPCNDLSRHEEKESCMSIPMQAKESGGFLRSSHTKGSVTAAQIDLAGDTNLIESDNAAAKQVFCEEKEETKSMPTSDIDILHEKSYSSGQDEQAACASETQFYHSQKASICDGLHLGPSSLQLESLDALDNDILYVNTGVLDQHHKEGYYEHNVYEITSDICTMSETEPFEVLETEKDVKTPSQSDGQLDPELDGDEAEKQSLNYVTGSNRILGTGSVMSKRALSLPGSGPWQQCVNKSTSTQATDNIEVLNQDHEEYNQNNEDQIIPGILASTVPEAVEVEMEHAEIEIGLAPASETLVLPVPDEQPKNKLEGDERQTTPGIRASSVPEAVEVEMEQSEIEIGLVPASETSVLPLQDEQPNSKLESDENQITPGIQAGTVPEAVEVEMEQSEIEIGLVPASETSVLPVPDEQPNSKLEGDENQITPGIRAGSVPEAVEVEMEQSEVEIGLVPALETSVLPVQDEQPNSKLESDENQITPGIRASSVPEAVEVEMEHAEIEIGLVLASETSVLPVPDEQPNTLEGDENQTTPGIRASSVPEALEIEQSETEIALMPAAETSVLLVPDEQRKLEGDEVDEYSCSHDKDLPILFDSELLKREASSLHKDDCMDLSSEDNHPNDIPAPRSPEQSACFQNDNDLGSVGICQGSRRRGIDELCGKLQRFKVSSAVKRSYVAMSAPRPKPGDSMSRSAAALLRNIENTTAVKAGRPPVKPNADGKDSSRRALQPISGRPREH